MKVEVLFFGHLKEKSGLAKKPYLVSTSDELKELLHADFPFLKGLSYILAVNQEICREKIVFEEGDEIAIMPPFAGG